VKAPGKKANTTFFPKKSPSDRMTLFWSGNRKSGGFSPTPKDNDESFRTARACFFPLLFLFLRLGSLFVLLLSEYRTVIETISASLYLTQLYAAFDVGA
jgi:hypothetical protein